jgi:ABC-2 type transport system ATP-binding protein
MIEVAGLTQRFGDRLAVDDLSFTVQPGEVTGLLGPNGAGKSTTMRMIVGLDRPTAGTALIDGREFRKNPTPMATLGALLDPTAVHRGRTGRTHLRALAASNGIGDARVSRVLEMTGMTDAAHHRISTYSLGMQQRIGIAAALLGSPRNLILDEPVNGLDPDGVHWVRQLVRELASDGCTVLISSHLMSEMSLTADRVIVIGRGRLIRDGSVADVIAAATRTSVVVRTPQPAALMAALGAIGAQVEAAPDGTLIVHEVLAAAIGDAAFAAGVPLHELVPRTGSLEEAFLELTSEAQEYSSDTREEGAR